MTIKQAAASLQRAYLRLAVQRMKLTEAADDVRAARQRLAAIRRRKRCR